MMGKRRIFRTSFATLMVVLLLPILSCFVKGPEREIQAKIGPQQYSSRGSILDRTGTLLAYSGVDSQGQEVRIYPYEDLARSVIGEVDSLAHGIYGIERLMEEGLGQGLDVYLTLERELQMKTEELLELQMRRFRALYGCLAIMNVNTGEILALSSRSRSLMDGAGFSPAPFEKELFHAGIMLLPLWRKGVEDIHDAYCSKNRCRPGWTTTEDGNHVWSPWGKALLQEERGPSSSFTKDLLMLGLGNVPDTIPLYIRGIFDTGLRATPLHILQAFNALISGDNRVVPKLVRSEGMDPEKDRGTVEDSDSNEYSMLTEEMSEFSFPALASVFNARRDDRKGHENEILALGFWPRKAPQAVFITAIKGASLDPRRRPGYLSRVKGLLEMALKIPVLNTEMAAN